MLSSLTAYQSIKKSLEQLSYRQSYSETFNHFLDFALYMLDPAKDTSRVKHLDSIYKEQEGKIMAEMFINWADACSNDGEGFKDCLGDLFMEFVSYGRNGQFFTPEPICEMLALMNGIDKMDNGKTVSDPACGSGRTLLAAAKINRHLKFYGADNDYTCCKMAALNMIVNTMAGEIAHMNTLSMEHYSSFHIKVFNIDGKMLPFYTESRNKASSFFL